MTAAPTCRTCDWWAGEPRHLRDGKRAACQHAAPRVVTVPDRDQPGAVQPITVRPMTFADERCPHWRARPQPEPAPEEMTA
jgi:hypothetical protein